MPASQSLSRFITAYGRKIRTALTFVGAGRTKQSFKDECDINLLMRRYQQTGVLEHVRTTPGRFVDTTGLEYQAAMEVVAGARSQFEELPAALRSAFDNDPRRFLEYMESDPETGELEELGMLKPEAVQRRRREREAAKLPPSPPTPENAAAATVAGTSGIAAPSAPSPSSSSSSK